MKAEKDYLTETEMKRFLEAAQTSDSQRPNIERDYLMVLMAYTHGFRVSELLNLKRGQIDLEAGVIHVKRLKGSVSTNQPLTKAESKLLRRYLRKVTTAHLWEMTPVNFHHIVKRIGIRAGLGHVHPHMLRHSCGYYLANQGFDLRLIQAYLGHKNVNNTVRYTQVNHARFKGMMQ